MSNFKEEIEKVVGEEKVEGVVIGSDNDSDSSKPILENNFGKLMSWFDAKNLLDYEYSSDSCYFVDCHPVFLWTPTRIIFVSVYDGMTFIQSVPRHPTNIEPFMPGVG